MQRESISDASQEGCCKADVCTAWEAAADPARDAGIRVVHLRIGVVLTRQGGALAKMLPPFRLGVGGPMGSGNQFMSWVTLSDLIRIIVYSIEQDGVSGPVNAVTPHAVTNLEFTKALGRAIKRPTALALPDSPSLPSSSGDLSKDPLK